MAVDFDRYKRLIQRFWDSEPINNGSEQGSLWCLGTEYPPFVRNDDMAPSQGGTETVLAPKDNSNVLPSSASIPKSSMDSAVVCVEQPVPDGYDDKGWPTSFLDDMEARLWFSYRSGFPAIPKCQDETPSSTMSFSMRIRSQLVDRAGFTSDTGWGCMIRSGQSLLANALLISRLGRGWRRNQESQKEREIISLFADDPRAPYSIHKFVDYGAEACGKYPGEWFGPSATARCIFELTKRHKAPDFRVYTAGDSPDVYVDSFMNIAKPDGTDFVPTVILIATRLGLDTITTAYWDALKSALQMPQSLGIAGGRPSSSHYFVGVQGSEFFYLDPHQTQPAIPYREKVDEYTETDINSCHTRRLRKLHVKELDPSMLLGFLIQSEDDWNQWCQSISQLPGKSIVHIAPRDPTKHGLHADDEAAVNAVESFDEYDDDDDDTKDQDSDADDAGDADAVLV